MITSLKGVLISEQIRLLTEELVKENRRLAELTQQIRKEIIRRKKDERN